MTTALISRLNKLHPVGEHIRVKIYSETYGCKVKIEKRCDDDGRIFSKDIYEIQDYAAYRKFKWDFLRLFEAMKKEATIYIQLESTSK